MIFLLTLACTFKANDDDQGHDDSGSGDSGRDSDSGPGDSSGDSGGDSGGEDSARQPIVAGAFAVTSGGYSDDGTIAGTWLPLISQPLTLTAADDGWVAGWPLNPGVLTGTVSGSTGGMSGDVVLAANDCVWTLAVELALEGDVGDVPAWTDTGLGVGTNNGAASCPALGRLVSDDGTNAEGTIEIDENRGIIDDPTRNYAGPGGDPIPVPAVADGGLAFLGAQDGVWANASSNGEGDGGLGPRLLNVAVGDWTLGTATDGTRTLGWLGEVAAVEGTGDGDVYSAAGGTDVQIDGCLVHVDAELQLALTGSDDAAYAVHLTSSDDGAADCVELAWAWSGTDSLAGQAVVVGTRTWME